MSMTLNEKIEELKEATSRIEKFAKRETEIDIRSAVDKANDSLWVLLGKLEEEGLKKAAIKIELRCTDTIAPGRRIVGQRGTPKWSYTYKDENGVLRGGHGFRTKKDALQTLGFDRRLRNQDIEIVRV